MSETTLPAVALIIHLAVSSGLLILIWLVQIIIYPGFERIASDDFIGFHRWYVRRISLIVLPLMISEVVLTTLWLWDSPVPTASLAAILVAVVWLSTMLLQVPIHNRLQSGKNETLIRRLVATNWIRTIAWSLKALLLSVSAVGQAIA